MRSEIDLATDLVRPPLQQRSQATLDRILEAAEDLLSRRLWETITLKDILEASGVSVGAFYARFPNREALLPCLYARYDHRLTVNAARVLDPARWQGYGLRPRVEILFRYVVGRYRAHRGIMRALALRARTHPDTATVEHRRHRTDFYRNAADLLLECRGEMGHPDPDQAVPFGLLLAGSVFREKILYDTAPHSQSLSMADRLLARETSRAFLNYVDIRRRSS